ncbi:MAG: hypothetical protein Crog4KO_20750 [Crocinitomicaceae bacterium]
MLGMAQDLQLDTEKAKVSFVFVSEEVEGSVSGIDATLSLNLSDLSNSSVEGSAKVATLTTGNKMRNKHLKSKEYFDVDNYPKMSFKSSSVYKKGEEYFTTGTITIKGVSVEVTFKMVMKDSVLVMTATINAADFGVSPKKPEKSNVDITIEVPFS